MSTRIRDGRADGGPVGPPGLRPGRARPQGTPGSRGAGPGTGHALRVSSSRTGPYDVHARDEHDGLEALRATGPDGLPVVLLRPAQAGPHGARVQAELARAAPVRHAHLLPAVDVLHEPDGRLVVVVPDGDLVPLPSWLAGRGPLAPGELVTLAVPLLAVLERAAATGLLVDRPDLGDVVLDDRGAPLLRRLRTAGATADVAAARASAAAASRGLVELVAGHLEEGSSPLLTALAAADDLDAVVEAVHDLAAPLPLPSAAAETDDATRGDEVDWSALAGPPRPAWAAALPEAAVVDAALDWLAARRETSVRARVAAVRPRFWLLGGVVAASVVIALLLSAPGASVDGGAAVATDGGGAAGPSPTPAPAGDAGDGADAGATSPPGQPPTTSRGDDGPGPGDDDVVTTGEDAVAAARVLLTARERCLADVTPSCLAAVDQPGSPVAARDAQLLDDPGAAGGALVPTAVEGEVQRLGETVLLDARGADDEPASVLVVRTEAGWRLREVVARR